MVRTTLPSAVKTPMSTRGGTTVPSGIRYCFCRLWDSWGAGALAGPLFLLKETFPFLEISSMDSPVLSQAFSCKKSVPNTDWQKSAASLGERFLWNTCFWVYWETR